MNYKNVLLKHSLVNNFVYEFFEISNCKMIIEINKNTLQNIEMSLFTSGDNHKRYESNVYIIIEYIQHACFFTIVLTLCMFECVCGVWRK